MKTIALPSMLGLFFALSTPALAIPETWVASNGSGVACTRAAPCATFQAAHNATDAGGVIKCADAGSYGPVTINRSITIDCTGTNGGIVATGIIINTAGVDVTLRGLSIVGAGIASIGVQFNNGDALHIEDCRISGIGGAGVAIEPTGAASVRAVLNRVTVEKNNGWGIIASGGNSTGSIVVQVRDSVVARNSSIGIFAIANAGQAFTAIVVDRSSSLLNGGDGIRAQGAAAVIHIGNSTVIGNAGGLNVVSGGQILSYQNNQASGNGVDGAPTGVLTVK
jgi:hypothetical protein